MPKRFWVVQEVPYEGNSIAEFDTFEEAVADADDTLKSGWTDTIHIVEIANRYTKEAKWVKS